MTGMTSATTPAACLIGWPAAHSRSPLIHHYWLRTLGIEGGYVIEAVPPDDFKDFLFGFRCAVLSAPTSPFRTRSARWRCRSRMRARVRLVRPIRCGLPMASFVRPTPTSKVLSTSRRPARLGGTTRRMALVLGAGGSARAVLFGLLNRGISAFISPTAPSRRPGAGRSIWRARLPVAWDALGDLLPRAGLLVNTTSLGMKGQPPLEIDIARAAVARRRCRQRLRTA